MAIPTSEVSLRDAREDMSLSPSGGLKSLQAYHRKLDYGQTSPIALKGDLGGTCFGVMPYTGENLLTGGTADWEKDPRCGDRSQCYGNKQDSGGQYSSGKAEVRSNGSVYVDAVHKNKYSNDIGFLTRHWAYVPDGKSITLKFRLAYVKNSASKNTCRPQVEIIGYKDGWASGSQKMFAYHRFGKQGEEITLGPESTLDYPYVMITVNVFTAGSSSNNSGRVEVTYDEIEATLT